MTRPREGPDARLMTPSEAAALRIAHATTETLRSERDRLFNTVEQQAAEIERLRADLERQETFPKSTSGMAAGLHIAIRKTEEQAARIKELEDALVEERARGNHYGMSYEEAANGSIERWVIDGEKDSPKFYLDRVRADARRQLQAEGKIGPDVKPRSWQITDERIEAYGWILQRLDYDQSLPGHANYKTARAMHLLRAMLEEVGR